MKRTLGLLLTAATLALACTDAHREPVTAPDGDAMTGRSTSPLASCDATYVSRRGRTIRVLPTGSDDTRNLQCAFGASRAGDVVQLAAADYHTAQVAVAGFKGKFQGEGAGKTAIYNLPNLVVTASEADLFNRMPDLDHTWPSLFAFSEGDLTVSDLAIRVVGEEPTTGWSIAGLELSELAHAIVVLGRTAHVRVHHVLVEAEPSPVGLLGTNLINGIFPQGAFGGNVDPMTGSFIVERSTFRGVPDPMPFSVVDGYRARFKRNKIEEALGVSGGGIANSSVEYAHNTVDSQLGFWLYDAFAPPHGVETSRILIRNNRLRGGFGAFFEATFGPDVRCKLIHNDTRETTNGLFLGDAESICRVIDDKVARRHGRDRHEAIAGLIAPLTALRGRAH